MANWAIVIGIDAYEGEDGAGAPTAVAEATALAEWLTRRDGGGVPERNLVCRLGEAGQPPGATYGHVVTAIQDVVDRAGGDGERFWFAFAGRGLETPRGRQVLCLQDFTAATTACSLDLGSLVARFAGTAFREQLWFVDGGGGGVAALGDALVVGAPPRLPHHPGGGERRDQYVCRATGAAAPGPASASASAGSPDEGAWRLLPSLLGGLGGEGGTARWDEARRADVVRWGTLVGHLGGAVEATGPRGTADAVLAVLAAGRAAPRPRRRSGLGC